MQPFNRDISQLQLRWLDRAHEHAESVGLDTASVLTAAKYPDHTAIDPSTGLIENRWYAERRRKGDVTVVVAFPPGETPIIWGVYYNLPLPALRQRRPAGAGAAPSYPTTLRELRRRIIEAGYVIRAGGKHDRVETPDGRLVYTLASTPGTNPRTMLNTVKELARKGIDVSR